MKLLLLLLLAQQQVSIVPVERGALLQADGGVVDVNGGAWFSRDEIISLGKEHADLRVQNEQLQAHAADVPYRWVFGAGAVGIVLGTIVGMVTARALPR